MERRYRDYSQEVPLTQSQIGEALKRLRHMVPVGPKDKVNIEKTIYQTVKNAGEIEIVFSHSLKDRLKVILAIDNGGWSMDPYVQVVQTLFQLCPLAVQGSQELSTFITRSITVSGKIRSRRHKPYHVNELVRLGSGNTVYHRRRCQHGPL